MSLNKLNLKNSPLLSYSKIDNEALSTFNLTTVSTPASAKLMARSRLIDVLANLTKPATLENKTNVSSLKAAKTINTKTITCPELGLKAESKKNESWYFSYLFRKTAFAS